jgi:hypothetical protein
MLRSFDTFCTRLSETAFSQAIQTTEWVIPAIQTVHIVAVAVVVTSILKMDLRLLGVGRQPIATVARRYLPPVWFALPVLLLTGLTLIVAEPSRALQNWVFVLKMGLLLLAAGVTLSCQLPLRRDAAYWDASAPRRRTARLLAVLSLPLWVAIVFAGRWIAYVQTN